jgi:hypothetical protein
MRKIKYDDLPTWVKKAAHRYEAELGYRPYDMEKKFIGKYYVYHVKWETVRQGLISEKWTRKKRHHIREIIIRMLLKFLRINKRRK